MVNFTPFKIICDNHTIFFVLLINNEFFLVFQVSGPETVELNVNMHCEACAEQLKKKILQMRGTKLFPS